MLPNYYFFRTNRNLLIVPAVLSSQASRSPLRVKLPDIDPTQQVYWNYDQQASNFNIKTNQSPTYLSYITNSHNFSSCPVLKLFIIIGLKEVTNALKQGYPTMHAITSLHYRVNLLYQVSATCAPNNTRLISFNLLSVPDSYFLKYY